MVAETTAARNVRLYPRFVLGFSLFAWMPVFFLYFREYMSLADVLRLEALYYAAVVLLEVPSGYFSDRVGRRPTLLVSSFALVLAYILFVVGDGFAVFAAAQILLAVAISFRSGTDTSFHYDSLADLGREREFGNREASVIRRRMIAGAVGSLLGGALSLIALEMGYLISLGGALFSLLVALRFGEPRVSQIKPASFVSQLLGCVVKLKDAHLAWLFGFFVLLVILEHVPYEFYQLYLELLGEPRASPRESGTPLVAGIVVAISTLIGAWGAGHSIHLRDWAGIHRTLMAALLVYVVMIAVMGLWLHPFVIALLVFRNLPQALVTAPLNAAVAPRVGRSMRATFFSLQSLAGRLAFSVTLMVLSLFSGHGGADDRLALSRMLLGCAWLGVGGLILLGVTVRTSRRSQERLP